MMKFSSIIPSQESTSISSFSVNLGEHLNFFSIIPSQGSTSIGSFSVNLGEHLNFFSIIPSQESTSIDSFFVNLGGHLVAQWLRRAVFYLKITCSSPYRRLVFQATAVTISRSSDFVTFWNCALYHLFIAFFYHFSVSRLEAVLNIRLRTESCKQYHLEKS